MSNIIDKIQVSGVTYDLPSGGGGGNATVELTQAEYDALVSAGTVSANTYYIITDAQAGDLTQYWTSAQTQSAITEATSGKVDTSDFNTYSASVETALSGKASQSDLETVSGQVANKQDTLVSGTNIKTINNQSLLGSGNITIQGGGGGGTIDPSLDSGSTNAVANSAITEAVNSKVNIADNNVSGFTYEASLKNEYNYSDEFTGPIYVKYGGDSSTSFTNRYAGDVMVYYSQYSYHYVTLEFGVLNGAITATSTESSAYYTITIQDGEAIITPSSGCYFGGKNRASNNFVFFRKIVYSSGQSANVIENTVYPMFGNLKDDLGNAVGDVGLYYNSGRGIGVRYTALNGTRVIGNDVRLSSPTIYMDGEGKLNTQFATPQSSQKVLNTGQNDYCYLFSYLEYSDAYDDLTITFNPEGYEGGNVSFNFNLTFVKNYNTTNIYSFTYSTTTSGLTYWDSSLDSYCTKDDTISADYKLKITAKDDYKINTFRSTNCSIGGVDTQYPEDYIVTLVTTTSNVQNGQTVIDDIYSTLSGKQDTLSAGTGIDITNNVISATGGGGGGTTYTSGRGIDITNDTISVSLPISAGTGSNSLVIASNNFDLSNRATAGGAVALNGTGYHPTYATGANSLAEGEDTHATGEASHAEGKTAYAMAKYSHAEGEETTTSGESSHAEGKGTITNNFAEHASGQYNVSSSGSSTFGDSGNTLFSVGNGTYSARHNAFEIRQNGDIYLTLNGQDVKLQDHLGGGSSYSAGTGIDITNNVISVSGVIETSAITSAITSSSTDAQVPSAKAVNDKLGGLSLVKLTQTEYDNLSPNYDSNTLYVIVN